MAQPIPLYPDQRQPEAPLESAEVLMINALLEDPQGFRPELYAVDYDMLGSHRKAWQFCVEHQNKTGRAPARGVFGRSFPDVELLTGVDPVWAADKLRMDSEKRLIRRDMMHAIRALNDDDLDVARDLIAKAARPQQRARPTGMSVYDTASVDSVGVVDGIPVPYRSLQAQTGGIGAGQFWILAARLGVGKSWVLPTYVVAAAESGADVTVLSLEMSKQSWVRRVQSLLARSDPTLQQALTSPDPGKRRDAVRRLPEIAGSVTVLDPSDIKMTTRAVATVATTSQLVVVDHVGLMMTDDGRHAVEDWRAMAVISNRLKQLALELGVSVLAASQINREGDTSRYTPPKISQLAQADALGQDGDVIITLRRLGQRAMVHNCGKNRNGVDPIRWYTNFLPGVADFSEISKDAAMETASADEDLLGDL